MSTEANNLAVAAPESDAIAETAGEGAVSLAPASPVARSSVRPQAAVRARAPGLWRAAGAIAGKELAVYFSTPLAWVLLAFFSFVMGYFFVVNVQAFATFTSNPMASPQVLEQLNVTEHVFLPLIERTAPMIFVFVLPFLTMRLIAEERRQHTLQLLMTAPIGSFAIVLGKFLAAAVLVLAAVALTMLYPLLLSLVSQTGGLEWQTAATAYLGLLLCGLMFVSLGLFLSSLTESQIVAGVATLVSLILLWVVGFAARAGSAEGPLRAVAEWISVQGHLQSFGRGIINLADLSYFLSFITVGLFLARTSLERQRW